MAERSLPTLRSLLRALPLLVPLWIPVPGFAGPSAGAVEWARYAAESTITVITTNADGSMRQTTVWLAVVRGEAYVRTGNTRWGDNAQSRPDVVVRIGKEEIPVRAERVEDEATLRTVEEAFRQKYGWEDRLLSTLRGSNPRIFHLLPRPGVGSPLSLHPARWTAPTIAGPRASGG